MEIIVSSVFSGWVLFNNEFEYREGSPGSVEVSAIQIVTSIMWMPATRGHHFNGELGFKFNKQVYQIQRFYLNTTNEQQKISYIIDKDDAAQENWRFY